MCLKALLACLGHRAGFIPSKTQGSLGHKKGWKRVWMTQGKSPPLGKQSSKTLCTYGIASAQRQSWSTHTRDKVCHCLTLYTSVEKKGLLICPPGGNRIGGTLLAPSSIALIWICFAFSTFPKIDPYVLVSGLGGMGRVVERKFPIELYEPKKVWVMSSNTVNKNPSI